MDLAAERVRRFRALLDRVAVAHGITGFRWYGFDADPVVAVRLTGASDEVLVATRDAIEQELLARRALESSP